MKINDVNVYSGQCSSEWNSSGVCTIVIQTQMLSYFLYFKFQLP